MKYLCIHGHFYQPPRENPWLEAIELQDSAYPYHDWNERITAECYAPNAATRIMGPQGRIERIVNNYSRISFNFGPTLLSWIRDKQPELYDAIRAADEVSVGIYNGHGCAIAQAYNHMILPLANARDIRTQVLWGIQDFYFHFRREPEGMWLPETAVNTESLEALAEHGIRFTILAPSQAAKCRALKDTEWTDVSGGRIDPTRPYLFVTPKGRRIAIFFYDGPISRAVAFERLLDNGEFFAKRLLSAFSDTRDWDQLAHIATDGESYGHHHRHGEMALAWALDVVERTGAAQITNYGEYLELNPPKHQVQIFENTAWSCVHGVGRWAIDCGCNSGGHVYRQHWRQPLRAALDWLRDFVNPLYEEAMADLVFDAWKTRDDYIQVLLDASDERREAFALKHALGDLTMRYAVRLWRLLELQRHAMLMYTSCGWFFDELSGIETVQVMQYAGRVVQLAEELFGVSLEQEFMTRLSVAKSNIVEFGDGAQIYLMKVKPGLVTLEKVGAHYAISSLFHSYPDIARVYCYRVQRLDYREAEAGRMRFSTGEAWFTSEVTQESGVLSFGVLHLGDHNISAGVSPAADKEPILEEAWRAFKQADAPNVLRLLDKRFGPHVYSVKSLFKDEQRAVLQDLLTSTLDEAEVAYRQLYEHNASLMRFLTELGTPIPRAFQAAAEYSLNSHLRQLFSQDQLDVTRALALLDQAKAAQIQLDVPTLEFTLRNTLESLALRLKQDPADQIALDHLTIYAGFLKRLPFPVNVWNVQNIGYQLLKSTTNRNGIHILARELAIEV
ncbi:MAG TPA: DUF3536 domain-containing protein [Bryobacteraceae bacterium]|jgi:alpha-amylase/alpha-mannosidase (GH57 family)|nr:DUF3536 domain-containing protein [Bryobacteraceae bacterium]